MKIDKECISCVLLQARRASEVLGLDEKQSRDIYSIAQNHVKKFNPNLPPPQNAFTLYKDIAKYLNVDDVYKDMKQSSQKKAREMNALCMDILNSSSDKLFCATKIAVVGNVIDLASQVQYDLKEELLNIINKDFAIDDFDKLKESLKNCKSLVYLADNAGEEVFDKIFIRVIKEYFKDINIYFFTRGAPIINDLTYQDALNSKMDEVATIIDSGVETPGFNLEGANKDAVKLFNNSDLIIAKGMGNYECLSEYSGYNIFHILKVKCSVVSDALGVKLGGIICKKA